MWRQSNKVRPLLGRYEGKFFTHAMDVLRARHNSATQKVVFMVTSDNYGWARSHLGNQSDTFYRHHTNTLMAGEERPAALLMLMCDRPSREWVRAPAAGPTSLGVDLALLSRAAHTIMDYGTFGLWAGLLAGGAILAPTGYTRGGALSPDLVWWHHANMSQVNRTTC